MTDKFNAITFDIDSCNFSQEGTLYTLEDTLSRFGLQSPSLHGPRRFVYVTITNQPETISQATGLLALSADFSKLYQADCTQLASRMNICDALYLWAQDGFNEIHDWPI